MLTRARWIHRHPAVDVAVAVAWVPIAIAAHLLEHDPSALRTLLAGVFLLSFAHQPLTLGLVYGDDGQRRSRPLVYTLSPVVFVVLIVAGLHISLALVAVIAGLWNAEHTLMQRYGITRLYGRKVGDDSGPLERAMLVSWLVLALVWAAAAAGTQKRIQAIDLGPTNQKGLELLHSIRPVASWLVLPVLAAVAITMGRWFRHERARGDAVNPAKHFYLASTAVLFLVALVDPIAGLVAYVGSHAVEYFVIVDRSLRTKASADDPAAVVQAVRTPVRRAVVYVGYATAIVSFSTITLHYGWIDLYRFSVLLLGALHIFYDGFIWKLRRPAVAASLGLPATVPA